MSHDDLRLVEFDHGNPMVAMSAVVAVPGYEVLRLLGERSAVK